MMIKASQQAIGLNDDGAFAATLPNAARTAAKTDTVPVAQAAQDRARVSMDYQQGFFSGPSS